MSGGVDKVTDVGQGKGLKFGVSPLGDLDCGEKEVCSLISGLGSVNNCGLGGEVGKDVLEPVLSNRWKHGLFLGS